MADFRKWIIALAVVLLFAGLASAQVGGGASTPLICTAQATTTPTIRQEGITELVGDILITCTGGTITLNNGNGGTSNPAAQQTNITVTLLSSQVTSRLLPAATSGLGAQVSEALLLIDEPNSGETAPIAGFGPAAGFNVCPTPLAGCGSFILTQTAGGLGFQTSVTAANQVQAPGTPTATPGPNTFQGVVQSSQVTFFGVPIVPPGTNGQRVYRIKNVRINATGFANFASVIANVSVTGINLSNPTPIVAFVQQSLSTAIFNAASVPGAPTSFPQCISIGQSPNTPPAAGTLATTLRFRDTLPGFFKTRLDSTVAGQTATGYPSTGPVQNMPQTSYNSESGFTLTNGQTINGLTVAGITGNGQTGLADFGTRFTAVFNNIPAGVHILVSQFDTSGNKLAQAVSGETVPDGNGVIPAAVANSAGLVDITPAAGTTATATWELLVSSPTAVETLLFNVYVAFVAAPPSPTPGTVTVATRYGPASTVTTASATANVPRFLDTSTPTPAFIINICRTVLLFPFLTNQFGFDTGIAVSNTSMDPFGTLTQSGSCTEYWYGQAAPMTPPGTPLPKVGTIAPGTTATDLVSVTAPGFQGYMIAICNFQFAHGFAFVSDLGARNLAMGYLALVMGDPSLNGGRNASDSGYSAQGSGEQLNQ